MSAKKLTDEEIKRNKTDSIMNIIAERCAYYRANPHRFAEDFIPGLKLRIFQKILLWAMFFNDNFYYVASRGQGGYFLIL